LEISNPADETTMFSGNRNRLLVKWLHISEDECFIYITKENLITCKFVNFNFFYSQIYPFTGASQGYGDTCIIHAYVCKYSWF